jgi:hypothetical protein
MLLKQLTGLFFFILVLSIPLKSQETIITGRVTELGVNSGIPFVNIFFKGTIIGTVTDFDGNYTLKTTSPVDSIFVSLIGFKSKAKAIINGKIQIINFQLSPQALNLTTVEVHPGINPALRIIKYAQENREQYNRNKLESVQYTSYTKQEADVDNVTLKMRKWRVFKGFTNLWDSLDRLSGEESKANLPVMMSEVISDIYSYKKGNKKHEDATAVKIKFVGMKDGSAVSQLTGTDFQNYNFNNNNIAIQNKEILNPIADNAMLFYNYYLIDSSIIDTMKCYRIDCRPKNNKDLAFTGSLWITDGSYSIKQLDLEITPDVNFNWLDRARVQQILIPTDAEVWVPSQTRTMIDFSTVSDKFVSIILRTYNSNKNFIVNQPKTMSFYETRIQYAEDALLKDTLWWKNNRQEKLTPLESKSYNMIDTVRNVPTIKTSVNLLYFLFSGYKDVGPIDFGHYMQSYSFNQYEGTKLKLGFRTNVKFSKKWIIRGYTAYGFKDKGFKYNLQLERIITRFPWSKAGLQYREDIDQAGTSFNYSQGISLGQPSNNLYNFSSNIGNISKLLKVKEVRGWYERDFNIGMNSKITFQNIRYSPLFPVILEDDQSNLLLLRDYTVTEILLDSKFSVKERYLQNGNERISFGNSKSAIIGVNFIVGLKDVFNGDFSYYKASVFYSNRFKMATLGFSKVFIKAGKVFSQIPYTLLEIPRGNETNFYANNTFNQMNLFEFVSDQYVEAFWQHHFNGLLFNRLPLLKKINWREVVGLNMAFGQLSDKNKAINTFNKYTVMNDVPYLEADLGIENILNLIRVDFLYRLTYNDDFYLTNYQRTNSGNKINVWGVKVGLQFSF